mgnify:CR=1 FL=1
MAETQRDNSQAPKKDCGDIDDFIFKDEEIKKHSER